MLLMSEIKYEKVRDSLIKDIENGKYQEGKKLPTESELMQTYNVSRYTIRRAMVNWRIDIIFIAFKVAVCLLIIGRKELNLNLMMLK